MPVAALNTPCHAQSTVGEADDDGWICLFNGKDLTGWTPKFVGEELGVNYENTFRVEDGNLIVSYDGWESFGDKFGHLFYQTDYSHYVFQCEYRFVGEQVPGGPGWAWRNNGIMLHGQSAESMGIDQKFPTSIEVQMLGGRSEGDRTTGNLCTPGTHVVYNGELYRRHCMNSSSDTFRGDQWVLLEIEVHGSDRMIHKVDGEVVMEYTQPQLDDGDAEGRAEMERRGGERLLDHGTISLQAESHPCHFRNLRLRVMEQE